MPGGDRRGPMGMGPLTGRGAGFCAGYATPGYANPNPGRGLGFGYGPGLRCGRGRGGFGFFRWGRNPWPDYRPNDPESEKAALSQEADSLRQQLDSIQHRLDEIENRNNPQ